MTTPQGYVNKEDVILTHPDLSKLWLDSGDVMRLLHCSRRTLDKLRTKGMPYYKVHTHYCLYKLDEVQAFIETHKITQRHGNTR